MKAPKYIQQDVIKQVCQAEQFQQHKFNLVNTRSDPYLSRRHVLQDNDKYQQIRANKFYTKLQVDLQKEQQLLKENKKILNRIVDIGNQKTYSSLPKRSLTRQNSANSIKSLNLSYRKKEAIKIVGENEKLMQRLQRTPSTFRNKETFLKDYKKQAINSIYTRTEELKNRISKYSQQNQQKLGKIVQRLTKTTTNQKPPKSSQNKSSAPSYKNSVLSQLRIEPERQQQKFQFPRIK
ncbi:unnamed protein product (macronuclear) [Paramecium tetraurelia]|uniref:Uncharacterized protein n=1 Tax=Paramecium tetraurelia TaxID=5888 RepID=A0E2R5_PARTE|nr:uncharacterized protein GSPATT00022754001 [Paramecium tetraurelia]CAK89582.1 unnamed protein product [Paramecium tetraurelia]|eukprot:XP_001456979.1 hypothetical protein (macronuclear) [Paramecium tetraurelia strain d4-2]